MVAALKGATSTIPIVFAVVNDPVGQGFITSLARPGGNITGFTMIEFEIVGKWLELLKEIAPGVRRAALVFNPETGPFYPVFLRQFGAVPASIGTELAAAPVRNRADLEATVVTLMRESDGGLIVAADAFNAECPGSQRRRRRWLVEDRQPASSHLCPSKAIAAGSD
jgi:putative tryptophan/tyrosine transport system substrate-binding protein